MRPVAIVTGGAGGIGLATGLGGIPTRNAYGAAKAGIVAMTRSMACEWARQGVRVNAVAPGYVRTELVAELARRGTIDVTALERRPVLIVVGLIPATGPSSSFRRQRRLLAPDPNCC